MSDIFELAYGEAQGAFAIITDLQAEHPSHRWLQWPDEADFARKYVALRSDEDVYFTATLYDENRSRTAEHATYGQVVYADADTCHPDKFRLVPSGTLETSPGKWHTYWRMDTPLHATVLAELSRLIATAHKAEGCDAGWIMSKILRVPNTTNNKDADKPYNIGAVITNDNVYTEQEIRDAYADITLSSNNIVDVGTEPDNLPNIWDVSDRIPEELFDLYSTVPNEGASWFPRLWKLKLELFRAGFTREEVYVVALNAKCNKWARDGRPEMLWPQVVKASMELDDEVIPEELTSKKKPRWEKTRYALVSEEERNAVADNPHFVNEYADWCMSKSPQSARKYHETLAYILLSCVYGSWGVIAPQNKAQKLNLWALILGPTTNTRKSTSTNRMLSVVHEWEKRIDKMIDIGGDTTAEGLSAMLNERANLVSLMQRDEIDGFLQEIAQKSYMAGLKQYLTNLYDGNLTKKWRAGDKEALKNVKPEHKEVVFNFLGIGIAEEVSSFLTAKDIASGFLPRFIWCVADPNPWTPEEEIVGHVTDPALIGRKAVDPFMSGLMHHFTKARSKYEGKETPIILSEEAYQRLMKWKLDTAKITRDIEMFETLAPGRDRLSYSIWKAAALLSMWKSEDTVSELTMLQVLVQSEDWFADLVRMASAVSDSEFAGIINEVEEFIICGPEHRRTTASLYKKFGRKSVVDEHIDNLVAQGRIKKEVKNGVATKAVVALV